MTVRETLPGAVGAPSAMGGRHPPKSAVPPIADLGDEPESPYDPDEAVALADEPTLYEEDEPGPHFIEVRIGEDEPETEGLPPRETTRS
jgi:hypothetical protein